MNKILLKHNAVKDQIGYYILTCNNNVFQYDHSFCCNKTFRMDDD